MLGPPSSSTNEIGTRLRLCCFTYLFQKEKEEEERCLSPPPMFWFVSNGHSFTRLDDLYPLEEPYLNCYLNSPPPQKIWNLQVALKLPLVLCSHQNNKSHFSSGMNASFALFLTLKLKLTASLAGSLLRTMRAHRKEKMTR